MYVRTSPRGVAGSGNSDRESIQNLPVGNLRVVRLATFQVVVRVEVFAGNSKHVEVFF